MTLPILLIPEKADAETETVAAVWEQRGGTTKRLGKYWIKDNDLVDALIAIYGNQVFALILAQLYNIELVTVNDALIAELGTKWTKRSLKVNTVSGISGKDFPAFVKPFIPKSFTAKIFRHKNEFEQVTDGLDKDEKIISSSLIENITAEARAFVMKEEIKDLAFYEGEGNLREAQLFLHEFISMHKHQLPDVYVADLAFSEATGWFVLEFNSCWGAGLNNCNAERVIDCIIEATINKYPAFSIGAG